MSSHIYFQVIALISGSAESFLSLLYLGILFFKEEERNMNKRKNKNGMHIILCVFLECTRVYFTSLKKQF